MSCSRTQHGDACGDRTQDLSIQSPTLYHYATAPLSLPGRPVVNCRYSEAPRTVLFCEENMTVLAMCHYKCKCMYYKIHTEGQKKEYSFCLPIFLSVFNISA